MSHSIKYLRKKSYPTTAKPLSVEVPSSTPPPENLKRLQVQAEQRVKLGVKLLNAAQTHTNRQQQLIEELSRQHQDLRDELQHDIAKSLQTYDQWMATFDERFTAKLQAMEDKIDLLQKKWTATEKQIASVVHQAQKLLAMKTAATSQKRQASSAATSPQPPRPSKQTPRAGEISTAITPPPPTDSVGPVKKPETATQPPVSPAPRFGRAELIFTKALEEVRRQQSHDVAKPKTNTASGNGDVNCSPTDSSAEDG